LASAHASTQELNLSLTFGGSETGAKAKKKHYNFTLEKKLQYLKNK
jgi:hypothetical protein